MAHPIIGNLNDIITDLLRPPRTPRDPEDPSDVGSDIVHNACLLLTAEATAALVQATEAQTAQSLENCHKIEDALDRVTEAILLTIPGPPT